MATKGFRLRNLPTNVSGLENTSTRTVPTVGTRETRLGKGVSRLKIKVENKIHKTPVILRYSFIFRENSLFLSVRT